MPNEGFFRECAIIALTKAVEATATAQAQKGEYGGSVEKAAWGVAEDLEVMICKLLKWYYADGFRATGDKAIRDRQMSDLYKQIMDAQKEKEGDLNV